MIIDSTSFLVPVIKTQGYHTDEKPKGVDLSTMPDAEYSNTFLYGERVTPAIAYFIKQGEHVFYHKVGDGYNVMHFELRFDK